MNQNLLELELINHLIYELHFREKFRGDGVYLESKECLLELVSKYLEPINYDRWAELYWKEQLGEDLSSNEKREYEILEKDNLEMIERVHSSLAGDNQIRVQIEKIRSHPWVRVIESQL